jgi:MFS family permease
MSTPHSLPEKTSATPPEASQPGGQKTWSNGSLTYTLGGLLVLMLLLLGGDFAWSMRERSVQPLFQILLRKFEASDFLTSLLIGSIPACITILVWPVVSVWSDRTRTRWGRRIPFLFFPTPFIFGAMVGLGYAPEIGVWVQKLVGSTGNPNPYILGVFGFFWVVFEVFALVTNSVFYGLVNDTVPRAMIGRFFGLFRMASLGAGVYFNFSLIGYAETHAKEVFLGIAALYLVGFTVMCLFVKEGTYPPPPPAVENDNLIAKVGRYFRECTQHRFYTYAFITLAVANLANMPINLFAIYTSKSYGIDTAQYGKFLAISYVCSFTLSFPLGWLSDRFHPMRTASACLAVYALAMTTGFFMVHDAAAFGVFFIIHTVLAGCFATTSMAVYPMVFPKSQFSQFYSAYSLLNHFMVFGAAPILGLVLKFTDSWYLLTFLISGVLGLISIGLWIYWYGLFNALGGVKNFVPPEPKVEAKG